MKNSFRKWLAGLLSIVLIAVIGVPAFAAEDGITVCADIHEAAVALREEMVQRREIITVVLPGEDNSIQIATSIMNEALAHTGDPVQGDYLRFSVCKCTVLRELLQQQGQSMVKLTYTMQYYTTAAQEAKMDAAVEELLGKLDVYTAGEYEKVRAVYDYICENISYDNWGLLAGDKLVYSAYAALVNKFAVCQGYVTLFYRLALELGVDARVISGNAKSSSHGWNIVRLGNFYYNLDPTWDAEQVKKNLPYQYFLCSEEDFPEHTRKASYATQSFTSQYPMAQESYDDFSNMISGDINSDGWLDEDDAIYLLQHVLMPKDFPVKQHVDYTADDRIDESDAVYLLQHILFPEYFPI